MEMSDSLHVPVEDLGHGARRFIWDMPYGRVLIDVLADGQVLVNGAAVGRSGNGGAAVDRIEAGRAEVVHPAGPQTGPMMTSEAPTSASAWDPQ